MTDDTKSREVRGRGCDAHLAGCTDRCCVERRLTRVSEAVQLCGGYEGRFKAASVSG